MISMNIAMVSEFFPPYITGGAEIFVNKLASYLKSKGHGIAVITSEQGQAKNEFKTCKIKSSPFHVSYRYQFHGITLPWMFCNHGLVNKLKKMYKKWGVDIVYVNNIFHLSFAPVQAARSLGIPIVFDVHDYWPVCFTKDKYFCMQRYCESEGIGRCAWCIGSRVGSGLLGLPMLIPLAIEKRLRYKEIGKSKMICHSRFVACELDKMGLNAEVIPYPVMVPKRRHLKSSDGVFRILFMGRLEERKGADLLLPLARYLKGRLEARIDVVGSGRLKKTLDRPDLGIVVHGHMGGGRLKLLQKADLMVVPSRWPEPFGMVVQEAMANELPVLGFDNGGLGELVRDTGGVATDEKRMFSKVLDMARDKSMRASIVARQKRAIKAFSGERIFERYLKIFENAVNRGGCV